MKRIIKFLSNKIFVTIISFLLQIVVISLVLYYLSVASIWVYITLSVFSIIVCLFINGQDTNPGYKLAWVVPILGLPIFGGILYITMGRQPKLKRKERKKLLAVQEQTSALLTVSGVPPFNTNTLSPDIKKLHNFIYRNAGYPMYGNTKTTYYDIGEKFHIALLEELEKAERFIFLEFFIIEEGKFWNSVLDVLERKAAQGVEVRLLYDDFGCLFTLPPKYERRMREKGIKTFIFNKIKPTFDVRLNNRTHRKIVVIDSKVAFTGGMNIADEYINEIIRFGHWKDTGMKFEGDAAWGFTVMFLRFWLMLDDHEENSLKFLPIYKKPETTTPKARKSKVTSAESANAKLSINADGYIQPIAGGPSLNKQLIENAFIQLIANADAYVYINTPYLVLDNEFLTTLCNAARSGVDVRITMPHVPDKKMVFIVSRSFYPQLLKAGVKIYEYTPGFLHAKSIVADDSMAYIGTCNLDYRSFYLHYECGAFLYQTPSIYAMKEDFLLTLAQCKEITYTEATDVTVFTRLARSLLRLFAPLM